jgi:hypothetical protein
MHACVGARNIQLEDFYGWGTHPCILSVSACSAVVFLMIKGMLYFRLSGHSGASATCALQQFAHFSGWLHGMDASVFMHSVFSMC